MSLKTLVKPSEYHDSVTLMRIARELTRFPGVLDAAVVMATEANKSLLEQSGLLSAESRQATPNDLVIAVKAEEGSAEEALAEAERLLRRKASATEEAAFRPRSLRGAARGLSGANMAVVSVAGRYAAEEAWDALAQGLHVLLFSDNVSLEDEVALKRYARDRGLLMMGPGAGTAIVNGVALGFANVLPRGPVGIVSAAGTGLQEVSTLLARHGVGVSQGLGTGGRDLKEEVGGIMFLEALAALQEDPETRVLLLISKPPADWVADAVLRQVSRSTKPAVVCFLGGHPPSGHAARTLQEAALMAAREAGADLPPREEFLARQQRSLLDTVERLRSHLAPGRTRLRGLFSGGTLCYEAQVLWRDMLSEPVLSNAPLDPACRMADSTRSVGHAAVDLGEEEFTVGRPHPMIDMDLRLRRMAQEARDPETAVILLDVVLGYGAHPDPALELGPAVHEARQAGVQVVCSVTGTEQDPQVRSRQVAALEAAGAVVCDSNACAALLSGLVVS